MTKRTQSTDLIRLLSEPYCDHPALQRHGMQCKCMTGEVDDHVPLALMSDPEFRASATLVASGCGAVYCVVCTIESVVGVPPCT